MEVLFIYHDNPIIIPVQLHPEYKNHPTTQSAVLPSELICTIKTPTVKISFFDGIEPHVMQAVMRRCTLMKHDYTNVKNIYIVCGKTGLRKDINGLATLVQDVCKLYPYEGVIFLFS